MYLLPFLRFTWCIVVLTNLQQTLSWEDGDVVYPRTIPGCYTDAPILRALDRAYHRNDNHHAMCRLKCGRDFKKLAATQIGKRCYCGNYFKHFSRTHKPSNICNNKCPGESTQKCGALNRNWVMHSFVPPLPGCFGDYWSRDLEHHAYTSSDNTNDKCRKVCGNKGYSFAGTQDGGECWCGNRYGYHWKKPDESCDEPCPGNSKQVCGGGWRNWVSVSAPVPDKSCLSDQYGIGYKGTMSWAAFGHRCVKWADVYADFELKKQAASLFEKQRKIFHYVVKTLDDFNRMSSSDKNSNYCRNIDRDGKGPWCFTDHQEILWDYCVIPICPYTEESREVEKITCKRTMLGKEYAGSKATTKEGLTCRGWSNMDVLKRMFVRQKTETDFDKIPRSVQISNLCRNPDDSPGGPWCYIEGQFPKWDYCGIPFCKGYGSQTFEKSIESHAIRLTPCATGFIVSTFGLVTVVTFGLR